MLFVCTALLTKMVQGRGALRALAAKVGAALKQGGFTVAIAESSAGGRISAALLEVPGASKYFSGGGVVYTTASKIEMLGASAEALSQTRSTTPEHALLLAESVKEKLGADFGLGETGVAGPTPNSRGIAPGSFCVAVTGPGGIVEAPSVFSTDSLDRRENMDEFAVEALKVLLQAVQQA